MAADRERPPELEALARMAQGLEDGDLDLSLSELFQAGLLPADVLGAIPVYGREAEALLAAERARRKPVSPATVVAAGILAAVASSTVASPVQADTSGLAFVLPDSGSVHLRSHKAALPARVHPVIEYHARARRVPEPRAHRRPPERVRHGAEPARRPVWRSHPALHPARARWRQAVRTGPAPARSATYVVRPGDSLWSIAARELGSGDRWRELWSWNKGHVPNPGVIVPGEILELQSKMLAKGVVPQTFKGHHKVEGSFYAHREGRLVWADDGEPVTAGASSTVAASGSRGGPEGPAPEASTSAAATAVSTGSAKTQDAHAQPVRIADAHVPTVRKADAHVPPIRKASAHVPTVRKADAHVPPVRKASAHVPTVRKAAAAHVPPVRKADAHVPPVRSAAATSSEDGSLLQRLWLARGAIETPPLLEAPAPPTYPVFPSVIAVATGSETASIAATDAGPGELTASAQGPLIGEISSPVDYDRLHALKALTLGGPPLIAPTAQELAGMSFLLPGSGQLVEKNWTAGIVDLAIEGAAVAAIAAGHSAGSSQVVTFGAAVLAANHVLSPIDAYARSSR